MSPLRTDSDAVPTATLVTVGDELLLGHVIDTNAAWLGREFADLGFALRRHVVVGDRSDDIQEVVGGALSTSDFVIVTGGLGPTHDDRTRPAVAELLDRSLHRDETIVERLRERAARRGHSELPPGQLRQADVPQGAMVLENQWGTAPGLMMEKEGRAVALLPGVPSEMKEIFTKALRPWLLDRFAARLRPVRFRSFHTTGLAESLLADSMAPILDAGTGPVEVAFLPRVSGVDVRLTVPGTLPEKEAEEWLDRIEGALSGAMAPFRFEAESGDLAEAVGRALLASGRTVAVAESCTGGLLSKRLTDFAGASGYFLGGFVAYADAAKIRDLGVAPDLLRRFGAVSPETAGAMASAVVGRFGSDFGLSITGVAGPSGGSEDKPVGTVCFALCDGTRTETRREWFDGGRSTVRERSAQAVLALLLKRLT